MTTKLLQISSWLVVGLLLALVVSALGQTPKLSAPSTMKSKVTTNIVTRLTSPITNRIVELNGKSYTNNIYLDAAPKKAHLGVEKRWDAVGPWPQFITYEVEVYDRIGQAPTIVSTTNCFYRVEAKDAPQRYIGRVRARDEALPNPSEWR